MINELSRMNCKNTGISETRRNSSGQFQSRKGFNDVYYSESDTGKIEGVAIVVDPIVNKAFLQHNPVNDRIISISLHNKPYSTTMIQVYAATTNKEDDVVEAIYGKLQETIDAISKTDCLYLIGDFDAKVRQQSIDKKVMENHGLGVINERRHRISEFCRENKLVIANTLFNHHNRRKYTWIPSDEHTINQIDYLITHQRWKSIV